MGVSSDGFDWGDRIRGVRAPVPACASARNAWIRRVCTGDGSGAKNRSRLLAEHSCAAERVLPDSPVEKMQRNGSLRALPWSVAVRIRRYRRATIHQKHLFFCITSDFVQTRDSLNGNATWRSPRSMSVCHACVMDPAYPHPACTMTGASCRNCRFRMRNTACFYPLPISRSAQLRSVAAALSAAAGRCGKLSTGGFIQA